MTGQNQAQRELRMDLARRVAAYARNGQTDVAPSVEHTDVSFFTDPALYELEYRKLFL